VLDTMLTYNGYSNSLMAGRLKQNQDCPCDHRSFTRVNLDGLRKATCEQILEASGTGPERVSLEIDEHDFAQPDSCDCGRIPLTGHFIRRQSRRCPGCGKALRSSFRTHREFNPKMIGTAMSIPLRELGASSARCAIVTTPVRGVLVFEGV
jgi:hypothetical protein